MDVENAGQIVRAIESFVAAQKPQIINGADEKWFVDDAFPRLLRLDGECEEQRCLGAHTEERWIDANRIKPLQAEIDARLKIGGQRRSLLEAVSYFPDSSLAGTGYDVARTPAREYLMNVRRHTKQLREIGVPIAMLFQARKQTIT